ncbi:MAG: hypothetical protein ACI8V2_002998 [Candidatus Latescibacterota bacterium]|jgi:hypothetical protein
MPGPNGHPLMSHLRWAPHAELMLVEENQHHPISTSKGTGVTLNFSALREPLADKDLMIQLHQWLEEGALN